MKARRVDANAAELTRAAQQLGFRVLTLNGAIDAVLWQPGTGALHLVDWKASAKARKTLTQARLVKDGWPVRFVASTADLIQLLEPVATLRPAPAGRA